MKAEAAAKIKYGAWGVVCGAVVAMIIGFGWGGWTTASTTHEMTGKAIVASEAAICVAQFTKDPLKKTKQTARMSKVVPAISTREPQAAQFGARPIPPSV